MARNIPEKETISVEFKSDLNCLPDSDILDVVVALANTDGGELYLGVEDDGQITGIHKKHLDITRLSAFIANHTVPPVSTRVEMLDAGKQVIKISVPKALTGIIATVSGKVLRRRIKADSTPESVPMYPAEQASRLSDLRMVDHSSIVIPEATVDDFDPLELSRLRRTILAYDGEKTLLELSDHELYKALGLCREFAGTLSPTMTGMLLLGRVESLRKYIPTHQISFQVLTGTTVRVNEDFELPILAAIEKLSIYLDAWNPDCEMEIGMFRLSAPEFDKRAVREAIVNAFSHRDYTRLGRVRVSVSDEGMTVANPGGFIEGVSLTNLLSVEPHGRNPALADALKRIGLAERTGRGIDRIYEGSLIYGRLLPDFNNSTDVTVSLLIPRSRIDPQIARMVSEEQKKLGRPISISALMVINALRDIPQSTSLELAEYTHLSETVVRLELENYGLKDIVSSKGMDRRKTYSLSSIVYEQARELNGKGNRSQMDREKCLDAVLELSRGRQYITRADVIELLGINSNQAYLLLKKLTSEGKLSLIEKGRYAKYKFKG